MKLVFVTNRLTFHQECMCRYLQRKESVCFNLVATQPIERGKKENYPDYHLFSDILTEAYINQESYKKTRELIDSVDVVVIGSAPDALIEKRLKEGKLTFKYAERFYKNGTPMKRWLRDAAAAWLHHGRFQKYPLYMLCASAYTAGDAARFGNYKNRCFKWGYFPETKRYPNGYLEQKKQNAVPKILWAGRFLNWKHPDDAILAAEKLKQDGYRFELNFIGTGPMEAQLETMIAEKDLRDRVSLLGPMKPEEVRDHMERTNIYLFTSDRGEGWGAVLNESMNSGCAVVASHAIGSVPFLVKDGENGLVYRSGDVDMLCEKIKFLLDRPEEQSRLGSAAYQTMIETWNAEVAAERLITLCECIQRGEETPYPDGPCSRAAVLKEGHTANESSNN